MTSSILLPDGRMIEKRTEPKVEPKGSPKVKQEMSGSACPQCGNARIFMMEVRLLITMPDNSQDHVIGTYSGCPGCTWVSRMVLTEDTKAKANEDNKQ